MIYWIVIQYNNTQPNFQIPTLIIYGSEDRNLGVESAKNLGHIPTSKTYVIPNAKHPAYLDDPALFHKLLYNFLDAVKQSRTAV